MISMYKWSEEDLDILMELYPIEDKEILLSVFVGASWNAIKIQANRLGLKRKKHNRLKKQYPIMDELTKHIISWSIAWEGSIMLHKQGVHEIYPSVSIGNTDFYLLERIKNMTGYGRCERTTWHENTNNKPVKKWDIRSIPEIHSFLIQIVDYLPAKKQRAALMIEYLNSRLSRWGMPYNDREFKIQEEISKLNRRGKQ